MRNMFNIKYIGLVLVLNLFLISSVFAQYLPPEQAFQTSVMQLPDNSMDIHFTIAPGYDIYQDKVHITVDESSKVRLGAEKLPPAIKEHNDILGDYYVYKDTADIILPIKDYADGALTLNINYQGCKGFEYCYSEIHEVKSIKLNSQTIVKKKNVATSLSDQAGQSNQLPKINNLNILTKLAFTNNSLSIARFFSHSYVLVVLGFFLFGILLAASPCIFPMLPILFTIVAGQNSGLKRSLLLATSYVLGMASAYAFAGVVFAVLGSNIQILLQNNFTNYILAIIFIVFSLSLFGLFEIRLPNSIQNKLFRRKVHYNNLFTTYLTGVISTMILSPCVTAPLAGALLYIGSTGNIMLGATALFAMGVGSGLPLLIIAVFGNKVLPKNGNWLFAIKDILGFLMLAMSIYIGTRGLSSQITILGFAILLIAVGGYFLISSRYLYFKHRWLFSTFNIFIILGAGYILGWQFSNNTTQQHEIRPLFKVVKTMKGLDKELLYARSKSLPVMLDFSADWCIACKELSSKVFSDTRVQVKLKNYYLIEVDITNNDSNTRVLMNKYGVMAPPSLVFIDTNGNVLRDKTVLGFIPSDKLLTILD